MRGVGNNRRSCFSWAPWETSEQKQQNGNTDRGSRRGNLIQFLETSEVGSPEISQLKGDTVFLWDVSDPESSSVMAEVKTMTRLRRGAGNIQMFVEGIKKRCVTWILHGDHSSNWIYTCGLGKIDTEDILGAWTQVQTKWFVFDLVPLKPFSAPRYTKIYVSHSI